MSWNSVIGQTRVKNLLRNAVSSGTTAHAYLFIGAEGVGKDALAIAFAKVLNCEQGKPEACGRCQSCRWMESLQHPDVRLIFALPTGRNEKTGDDPIAALSEDAIEAVRSEVKAKAQDPYRRIEIPRANFIKVNSIRQIRRDVALAQSGSGRNIFLVLGAERLNLEASNSLLKTLEEPPPNTVIMLTSAHPDQLLPTIISRCQIVDCDLLSETEISETLNARDGVEMSMAVMAAELSNGSYGVAREILSADMHRYRDEVVAFMRSTLGSSHAKAAQEIEVLTTESDRLDLDRWLRTLQLWIRAAYVLREVGPESIGAFHKREDLQSFLNRFPAANLVLAQEEVERSIALVRKNIYLPLVFLNLANNLRNAIRNTPNE